MSRSKTKTKRRKVWVTFDAFGPCELFTERAPALKWAKETTTRFRDPTLHEVAARLVEHLPGDVVLSREDAEELAEIVAAVVSEREYPLHYGRLLALLRGRR